MKTNAGQEPAKKRFRWFTTCSHTDHEHRRHKHGFSLDMGFEAPAVPDLGETHDTCMKPPSALQAERYAPHKIGCSVIIKHAMYYKGRAEIHVILRAHPVPL